MIFLNFEIFFALIGIPGIILITAVICYIHTGLREDIQEMKQDITELKHNKLSEDIKPSNRKGETY